jgi:hypothetical protein
MPPDPPAPADPVRGAARSASEALPPEPPPLLPPRPRWQVAPWLATYRASCLPYDLLAGLTLAAYAIPVSLA